MAWRATFRRVDVRLMALPLTPNASGRLCMSRQYPRREYRKYKATFPVAPPPAPPRPPPVFLRATGSPPPAALAAGQRWRQQASRRPSAARTGAWGRGAGAAGAAAARKAAGLQEETGANAAERRDAQQVPMMTAALSGRARLVHTRAACRTLLWRGVLSTGSRETHWGCGGCQPTAMPPHRQGEGASQAQDQTKAVWHPRASDPGGVCDTPGAVRRRTRRRLPGGHAPVRSVVGLRLVSDAGGSCGSPRRA
jgi:hypothetical protein